MARPAAKKAKKNTVNKTPKRVKQLSTKDKVEKSLKSARAEVERQQENLRAARNTLRARRIEAAKKGTRGSKSLVDKAYAAVARNVVSLDKLQRKASVEKAKVKIEKILQQAKSAELRAEEKILALEIKLTEQAENQLKITLEKFEARWLKKRALSDARKLKIAKRNALSKGKVLAKKAQTEIRVVEKKVAKATAKPVASPGRPGRPKKGAAAQAASGASASKKAAPKRRGRPPKSAAKTVSAGAPKKRGRPPKAKIADKGKAPASKAALKTKPTAKRRGRPPKAATTVQAPKRRGRPPKAK